MSSLHRAWSSLVLLGLGATLGLTGCGSVVWHGLGPSSSGPTRGGGVYLYRTPQLTAGGMIVHVSSGRAVRQIYNDSYAFLPLAPGRHLLTVTLGRTRNVVLNGKLGPEESSNPSAGGSAAPVVVPTLPSYLIQQAPTAEMKASLANTNVSLAQANMQATAMTAFSGLAPPGDTYPYEAWSLSTLSGGATNDGYEIVIPVDVPQDGAVFVRVNPEGISTVGATIVEPSTGAEQLSGRHLAPGGFRD